MKIAITGHRPNKLGNDYDLTSNLVKIIKTRIVRIIQEQLAEDNTIYSHKHSLVTGMALGIDTLFAQIAIEMGLPFIAAIPCLEQDTMWPNRSRSLYSDLINHPLCTQHIVHNGSYNNTCMQKRNEWMVDNCDLLIAVWDGTNGGTANCVRYAQLQKKEVKFINPKEIKI